MNHMTWPCIDGRLCITWYDYVWCITWYDYVWWIIWHDHPSKVGYVYYIMTWPGGGGFRLDITWHATNHHMHSSLVLNIHSTLLLYIYQLYIHQSIKYLLIYISVFRLISFSPVEGAVSSVKVDYRRSRLKFDFISVDLLFATPHLQGDTSTHGHDWWVPLYALVLEILEARKWLQ